MIKRFNENWGPLKDGSREGIPKIFINKIEGVSLSDSLNKALIISKNRNSIVILNIDNIQIEIQPQNNLDDLLTSYNKQIKYKQNDKDYWNDYWNEKIEDPDFEMDTISDYAMQHSISREEAERYFKSKSEGKKNPIVASTFDEYLKKNSKFVKGDTIYDYTYRMYGRVVDYNPDKEEPYLINFEDGTSVWLKEIGLIKAVRNSILKSNLKAVIGIPSGQIIYMIDKQIKYFQARKLITYENYFQKSINDEKSEPIKIDSYVFKDTDYENILSTMYMIVW